MKIRYLVLTLLMIATMSTSLKAQEEADPLRPVAKLEYIYLGVTGGLNMVSHSANLKTFAYNNICPSFEHGAATGFHGGVFYEQFLGDVGTAHSLVIRALYNTYPTSFSVFGDKQLSRVKDPSLPEDHPDYYREVYTTTQHLNEVKYNAATVELMYKFRFLNIADMGALVATLGPTVDVILTNARTQTVAITDPDNVQFIETALKPGQRYSEDRRTLIAFDGDIEDANSIRFGVKAGIQLELNIPGLPVQIIPGVFYNLGLTDVNNEDWKVSAFQPSVDIRIPIGF